MRRLAAALCIFAPAALYAQAPPPVILTLPDANPFAVVPDTPPTFVTHDFPSGVRERLAEFVAMRLDAEGKVVETIFIHDPIPSLEPQQKESFAKWKFDPPMKGGAPAAGWATIRLDLNLDYSRPSVEKLTFTPIGAQDAIPSAAATRWDDAWLETAPPLKDPGGAYPVEALDTPPLPKKTKWYADRFKGPISLRFWVEAGTSGRALRLVPVDVRDAALIPYFRAALSRWTLVPAHKNNGVVTCWGLLEITGTMSYDIDLAGAASLKKSAGLP
jgi:hypothetical protein